MEIMIDNNKKSNKKLRKDILLNFISNLSYYSGLDNVISKNNQGTVILYYHEINRSYFYRHIDHLRKKFDIISLDEFYKRKNNEENLKNTMVITFDDGFKSIFDEVFPVIKKFKIPVLIYLISDIVGTNKKFRWMKRENDSKSKKEKAERISLNWKEINKMLRSGHISIGSHTKTHPNLTKKSLKSSKEEIEGSKKTLEEKLNTDTIRHFSYPYGKFSEKHKKIVKNAGFITASTTISGYNNTNTDQYELKRIGIGKTDSIPVIETKINGIINFFIKSKHKIGVK